MDDIIWGDLQMAVSSGDIDETRKLIESGIDINKKTTNNIFPFLSILHLAVYSKNAKLLSYLLDLNRVDVHITDQVYHYVYLIRYYYSILKITNFKNICVVGIYAFALCYN